MFSYCLKCNEKVECLVKAKTETFPVKKEPITIHSKVCACKKCGEELFNEELDTKNMELAYGEYRRRHNILSPAQIIALREKYGLSQRSLGALLGWGEITIHRYETGMLPDEAHNEVLSFIEDPISMLRLYERNKTNLPVDLQNKLKANLDVLLKDKKIKFISITVSNLLNYPKQDIYNGYKVFDLQRFYNLVLYILSFQGGVYKTKLNKLLWYVDFFIFKTLKSSLTGTIYVHLPLGPVPDQYEDLLKQMFQDGLINIEEKSMDNGKTGELFTAKIRADKKIFTAKEMKNIDFVLNYFKNYTCTQIKDHSHKEIAYVKTKPLDKIPYKWAKDLSI